MEEEFSDTQLFDAAAPAGDEALIVALEGFEGPIDLLLPLARSQKVDLLKISVLQLADQFLAFVETARGKRLELAADYLVVAAWLTYLKSRLLLPHGSPEKAGAEEMAEQLRWRLARLQSMREASGRLFARDLLNRDVFARGQPEPISILRTRKHSDTLYDLLSAYTQQRIRNVAPTRYAVPRPPVYLLEEARARVERFLGQMPEWRALSRFLPPEWAGGARRRSALASTFSAALELTRDGRVALQQLTPYGEIYLKDRSGAAGEETP